MDNLPQDPFMLLSVINMKLRDSYSSLDQLCDDLDVNCDEIKTRLAQAGFEYDATNNRFA
jgi:hypothetical protein